MTISQHSWVLAFMNLHPTACLPDWGHMNHLRTNVGWKTSLTASEVAIATSCADSCITIRSSGFAMQRRCSFLPRSDEIETDLVVLETRDILMLDASPIPTIQVIDVEGGVFIQFIRDECEIWAYSVLNLPPPNASAIGQRAICHSNLMSTISCGVSSSHKSLLRANQPRATPSDISIMKR